MDATTMDLTLEPSRTALVAIDLQRGLAAQPMTPYPVAEMVERTTRLAHALRAAGGTVILVRVIPSFDGKDALRPLTDEPPAWPRGSRPADWAEIVPELGPDLGDLVISKRQGRLLRDRARPPAPATWHWDDHPGGCQHQRRRVRPATRSSAATSRCSWRTR